MAMESIIYHNPRCKKSREALAFMLDKGVEPDVVLYLKNTPTRSELEWMLARLHLPVEAIIRKEEQLFIEKFKTLNLNQDEWIDVLLENPILIQRPLVGIGNRAVIGRDLNSLNALFES